MKIRTRGETRPQFKDNKAKKGKGLGQDKLALFAWLQNNWAHLEIELPK